jgi:hypothetical protein
VMSPNKRGGNRNKSDEIERERSASTQGNSFTLQKE